VRAAVERPVRGAFNLAGPGLLRRDELGELVGARTVTVPNGLVRTGLDVAWRARVLPVPGSLFEALRHLPVLSTERAARELGWTAEHTAADAVAQLLDGARLHGGSGMPPLHP
jgi:UDP-glucose 4-epimerase